MNRPRTILLALLWAGPSSLHAEVPRDPGTPSQRLTHAQLANRGASHQSPLAGRRALSQIDPATVKKREPRNLGGGSLLSRSSILCYRGSWTIVPKGALLHIPASYQTRVVTAPQGRLIPWSQFYARNRGWIHTQAVTLDTARGETALSDEVRDLHKRLGRIVVAVLHNGPISVKAPPTEAEAAPASVPAVASNR